MSERFPEVTEDAQSGLVVWIEGTPKPQPRPRFVGKGVVSTTGKARSWRDRVAGAGRRAVKDAGGPQAVAAMLGEQIEVGMCFALATRSRADVDNLAKLVLDALMQVGALGGDDRRVVSLEVHKQTGVREIGCMVVIRPVPDAPSGEAQAGAGSATPGWLVGREG